MSNERKAVSLEEIKDQMAREHGYDNWLDFAIECPSLFSTSVARRYAQAVAGEVRARCAENAKTRINDESTSIIVDSQSILNTKIELP